ncbi:MAG: hypothetical protein AAFZ65_06215 [Planctomycetota bacterium]
MPVSTSIPLRLRLPRLVGMAGLGAALALAGSLVANPPERFELDSSWGQAWIAASAVLLFAYPLTMLALWRNADYVAELGPDGAERLDPRGRPRRKRVERPGSRRLFNGLVLQSTALLVLMGALLFGLLGR